MLLRLNFFIFGVNERLSMHKLHLDRLEVLLEDLQALLMLFDF